MAVVALPSVVGGNDGDGGGGSGDSGSDSDGGHGGNGCGSRVSVSGNVRSSGGTAAVTAQQWWTGMMKVVATIPSPLTSRFSRGSDGRSRSGKMAIIVVIGV